MKRILAFLAALLIAGPTFAGAPAIPQRAPDNLFQGPALPIAPAEVETCVIENVVFNTNTTTDLLPASASASCPYSPSGPGYVSSVWLTFSSTQAMENSVLSVYVDGEGSPSFMTDLGSLGPGVGVNIGGQFGTQHIQFSWNPGGGGGNIVFTYPIPYKSRIHITLTNPASGSANTNLWSHVTFNQGNRPPYKLWSSGTTYINRTTAITPTQQGNGTIQYLNLGAGNSGVVVYHGIFFTNPTNQTYLENNIVAYLDGTPPGAGVYPQYNSSGTEDYFQSSFYFPGNISQPWMTALVGTQSGNSYSTFASLDLLALHGGIKFNNGILIRSETGQATAPGTSTTNVDENWLVLYYMPY